MRNRKNGSGLIILKQIFTIWWKKIVKIGPVVAEIFGGICQFLPYHLKSLNFLPRNLWHYWTKVHQICTQCRGIIGAIKPFIHIVIFQYILKCQSAQWLDKMTKLQAYGWLQCQVVTRGQIDCICRAQHIHNVSNRLAGSWWTSESMMSSSRCCNSTSFTHAHSQLPLTSVCCCLLQEDLMIMWFVLLLLGLTITVSLSWSLFLCLCLLVM